MGSRIPRFEPFAHARHPSNFLFRLINVTTRSHNASSAGFDPGNRGVLPSHCRDLLHRWPYEFDSYDDHFAEYLVVRDSLTSTQLGSLRLLRTDRPHVLGSLFPDLCEHGVPRGLSIREITQIHLSSKMIGRQRRTVANQLASTLIQYGLLIGIESFTVIVEAPWADFLQGMGWRCEPLGPVKTIDATRLGAFQIHVDSVALEALRASHYYVECDISIMEPDPVQISPGHTISL